MAISLVQSNQVVNDAALNELNSAARDSLLTILPAINSSFTVPGKITASSKVVTIGNTSISYPDTRVKGFPLVDGKDLSNLSGTYSLVANAGTGTGDVQSLTPPSMTNGNYIRLGFEVRSDKKIYPIFGAQNAVAASATFPAFSSGVPLGVILLHYSSGVFDDISASTITQYIGAGAGAGGDSSFKIRDITGSTATINAGFIQLNNGYTLVTGSGTDSTTTNVDISINLASLVASPVNATTYYLYIDLWKLSDPINLTDNGRKIINVSSVSQFSLSTVSPDAIQLYRYVYVGFVRSATSGNAYTGTGASFGTSPTRVHMGIDDVTPVEMYEASTQVNSTSLTLSHGLTGEPQFISLFYYNGTYKISIDPSSILLDKNSSSVVLNTNAFDFTSGKYLEVKAVYNNRYSKTAVMMTNQYTSAWFTDTSTTTVAHNLGSMEYIKGAFVLEWNVTTAKVKVYTANPLITNWDDTNIYLSWSGITPSSTLKYQVIIGNAPMTTGIPYYVGGYTKFVGFGPGSYGSLATALASAAAGDSILVNTNQSLSADLTIATSNIKIQFMPNVTLTFATGNGLIITGSNVELISPRIIFTTTVTNGVQIQAANNVIDRAIITVNGGVTITNLLNFNNAAADRNYVNMAVVSSGTVTNVFVETAGATYNDINYRGI